MLVEIIGDGAIACLGWGGRSLVWDGEGDRSFGNGNGEIPLLLFLDRGRSPLLDKSKSAIALLE